MQSKLLFLFISLFTLSVYSQKNEGINWSEASINEKIKLEISVAEFEERYKKADSIVDVIVDTCPDLNTVATQYYYYRGVCFEKDNDMLKFKSVDFSVRKRMYFAIDDDWFDHTTSLNSFRRSFPEQSQYIEDEYDYDGEEVQKIIIFPRDLSEQYEWNFYFKKEKLYSIVFTCN